MAEQPGEPTWPPVVAVGAGDESDVEAGRCCPTCRHDLTEHNRAVWEAGYTIALRHERDLPAANTGGQADNASSHPTEENR